MNKNGQTSLAIIIPLLFLVVIAFLIFSKPPITSPAVFLLALVVFIIAFIKTDVALIILIFSMLLSPEFNIGGIPGRAVVVRADDVFLFVVFFGWLAKMAVNKELGLLKSNPLNKPILIYTFIVILATLLGALQGYVNIKYSSFYILKYIEYFLLFFMVTNNIRDIKQVKIFVFFILFVCFLVSIYAWWLHFTTPMRVTAPFEGKAGEANTLAGYLLLIAGVILGLILYPASNRQRILLLALLGFIMPVFLFTLSRGAWLGFFPMFLTLVIISRKVKNIILITFITLIILSPLILPEFVKQRVKSTFVPYKTYTVFGRQLSFDEASVIRIEVWKNSIERWSKRPILGYGVLGGGGTVDSQYARVLIETGMLGFIAFTWLMVMIFRVGWRTFKAAEGNNFARGLSLGFIAGFAGLLTQALTAGTFIIVRIMEPFWFLAAIVVSLPELIHQLREKE